MDKTNNRLQEIFNRYADKMASEEEKNELWDYINDPVFANEIDALIGNDYERIHEEKGINDQQRNVLLKNVFKQTTHAKGKTRTLWPRLIAAASIVLISGITFYFYQTDQKNQQQTVYQQDVSPGRNRATLTLANGETISITDANTGNIASQSGVRISKTADGQIVYEIISHKSGKTAFNTLTTARGEQTRLRLPDGSLVYLNAASVLKYPTSFAGLKNRPVELSGEAYFEISKDKTHPFIVSSGKQEVEVLGTHFNVNAYGDETTVKTTLLEGSIRLSTNGHSEILKPNEQAMLANDQINISKVDPDEAVAWKNNEFLFRNDDFKTNMRKIARWYDIEVIYEANAPENFRFGGFLSRTRNLSAVLRLMEKTGAVHFRIEGKKLYVSK
ncbi:FecR family protein [Pedobacter sp. MC2016-24]|uniref:FecR family protein n=1 Tax=Pedobacter sp. MC2016-24 TaxID=2780090 RepID=UPI00187FF312|nr:FecR family protein [Pedobacter sp. MC2016-24]MBE9598028.1 FecR domain-containing protein [Pedobacter sp. MC2016-24]